MNRIVLTAAVLSLLGLLGLLALPAQADDVMAGPLKISAAWARATPKGASVGGGYLTVTNTGTTPDSLIGGATAVAKRFEVHEMKMDNGIMKMRPLSSGIEIKPGQSVTLAPGGFHVMFVGLTQQLKQGEHFKATLEFAKAGKVDVDFTVEGLGAMRGGGKPGMGAVAPLGGMQMK